MTETEIPDGWIPEDELLQSYYGLRASRADVNQAETLVETTGGFFSQETLRHRCRWFISELLMERRRFEIAVGLLIDSRRQLNEAYNEGLKRADSLEAEKTASAALRNNLDEALKTIQRLTAERSESTSLSFDTLRTANIHRLPQFKNGRGEPAHSSPYGNDWCLAQWSNAVLGELGEAANIIKKIERGDYTLEESRHALSWELADVQTYLDILAFQAEIDLGAATVEKFNEVSKRVGATTRIDGDEVVAFIQGNIEGI